MELEFRLLDVRRHKSIYFCLIKYKVVSLLLLCAPGRMHWISRAGCCSSRCCIAFGVVEDTPWSFNEG